MTAPVGAFRKARARGGSTWRAANVEWTADLWQDLEEPLVVFGVEVSVVDRSDCARPRVVAPTGPAHGSAHVIRGGGYYVPAFALRTAFRLAAGPAVRSLSIGFRCAYDAR